MYDRGEVVVGVGSNRVGVVVVEVVEAGVAGEVMLVLPVVTSGCVPRKRHLR
jgi:hypothetical protein